MKARVSQLHKTAAEWKKFDDWVPAAGELVVYDPDNTCKHSRVKIGDGVRELKYLGFAVDNAIESYLKAIRYAEILDGGFIRDYR